MLRVVTESHAYNHFSHQAFLSKHKTMTRSVLEKYLIRKVFDLKKKTSYNIQINT